MPYWENSNRAYRIGKEFVICLLTRKIGQSTPSIPDNSIAAAEKAGFRWKYKAHLDANRLATVTAVATLNFAFISDF